MRVLVTGGNGFIGSTLVDRLLTAGHQVRCLVHHGRHRLVGRGVDLIDGSVTEPDRLDRAVDGVDLIYHLAGRATDWGSLAQFARINEGGTRHLLAAAGRAGVGRFVHMSSLAVHRFVGYRDADETVPADQNRYAYGISKAAAERAVWQAHDPQGLRCTVVRPGLVILGPEDTTAFVHMAPMLAKGRWTHVRGGRPLLCYSYVENLCDGLLLAGVKEQAAGETLVITDDLRLSWRDLISALVRAFGVGERSMSFPAPLARAAGIGLEWIYRLARRKNPPPITGYRTALVARDFHFGCEKAKRLLSYQPKVSFEEGLARTVAWYRASREAGR